MSANCKPKRTAAALRGFLAPARHSCFRNTPAAEKLARTEFTVSSLEYASGDRTRIQCVIDLAKYWGAPVTSGGLKTKRCRRRERDRPIAGVERVVVWGSVVSSLCGDRGGALAVNGFWSILSVIEHVWWKDITVFLWKRILAQMNQRLCESVMTKFHYSGLVIDYFCSKPGLRPGLSNAHKRTENQASKFGGRGQLGVADHELSKNERLWRM